MQKIVHIEKNKIIYHNWFGFLLVFGWAYSGEQEVPVVLGLLDRPVWARSHLGQAGQHLVASRQEGSTAHLSINNIISTQN